MTISALFASPSILENSSPFISPTTLLVHQISQERFSSGPCGAPASGPAHEFNKAFKACLIDDLDLVFGFNLNDVEISDGPCGPVPGPCEKPTPPTTVSNGPCGPVPTPALASGPCGPAFSENFLTTFAKKNASDIKLLAPSYMS